MVSKIPNTFRLLAHNLAQLNAFMSVGILLKYFRPKLLQFERSKTLPNLGMSHFIADQVVFRCFFHKNFALPHSKSYICKTLTAFL